MARTIESVGDIETICKTDPAKAGEEIKLVFRAEDDAEPPFNLKVKSPSGKVIVERVIRDLPTGKPQSAPPVTFTASAAGEYKVEIKQLYGKQKGDAILRIVD
ncbi:MAG: hypothetical protein QM820_50485 [Minicystis sp.]